ncbi:MAG: FG-GAP repeat domain-containing protein, partial [bacterium]
MARLMVDGASLEYETESYLLYTESVDPYTVRVETLPTDGAHGAAAGDIDGDGLPEVVFTNHGDSYTTIHPTTVYWNGPHGFSADAVLTLPALGGHGASVADVNGDGLLDLVVSNYYDGHGRTLPSYVHLNEG